MKGKFIHYDKPHTQKTNSIAKPINLYDLYCLLNMTQWRITYCWTRADGEGKQIWCVIWKPLMSTVTYDLAPQLSIYARCVLSYCLETMKSSSPQSFRARDAARKRHWLTMNRAGYFKPLHTPANLHTLPGLSLHRPTPTQIPRTSRISGNRGDRWWLCDIFRK
jgi:hypothetical protein